MTAVLTVAFVPGVSPAKWARIWRERMPDAELWLRAVGPTEVDATLAGDVDMCFVRLPVSDDLRAIPLWTETPVVATPKDSALADHDTVTTADLAGLTMLGDGPVPDDVDAVLDLVETGVGIAVLPQSLFRAASRKDLVGRPLTDVEGTRIALAWRSADENELTDEFIGIVRGRSANSSRGRGEPEPEKAPEPQRKQAPQKKKAVPGGPNSRGAQLAANGGGVGRGGRPGGGRPGKGGAGKQGGKGSAKGGKRPR